MNSKSIFRNQSMEITLMLVTIESQIKESLWGIFQYANPTNEVVNSLKRLNLKG